MLNKIKELADEAIALQNKDRMDAALREIRTMCEEIPEVVMPVVRETSAEYLPRNPSGTPAKNPSGKGGKK